MLLACCNCDKKTCKLHTTPLKRHIKYQTKGEMWPKWNAHRENNTFIGPYVIIIKTIFFWFIHFLWEMWKQKKNTHSRQKKNKRHRDSRCFNCFLFFNSMPFFLVVTRRRRRKKNTDFSLMWMYSVSRNKSITNFTGNYSVPTWNTRCVLIMFSGVLSMSQPMIYIVNSVLYSWMCQKPKSALMFENCCCSSLAIISSIFFRIVSFYCSIFLSILPFKLKSLFLILNVLFYLY